jgi:hypothetical protein
MYVSTIGISGSAATDAFQPFATRKTLSITTTGPDFGVNCALSDDTVRMPLYGPCKRSTTDAAEPFGTIS